MNATTTHSGASCREALAAAALLLLTLVLFFREPLLRYSEVHYAPADLTQALSLTRLEPGHPAGNQLMSDAVTQMEPWLMFNRDELAAGRVPLWNPLNGAGAPHLANYQSAVFSPFSWPYYVLSFKAALLVSAVLKLFAIGFFTWLYLRKVDLRFVGALLGAVAFMYAGHQVLLLYFPHVGSMVALPATLWCLEVALQRFVSARLHGQRPHLIAPLTGITLALWTGLMSGNPEPFFFNVLFIAPYAVWRLAQMARHHPKAPVVRLGCKLLFAATLAAGLAAFQLLPFFEYLANSRVLEQRSYRQTPLDWQWWPLMLFPDLLGNPAQPYKISINLPAPNYELVNMAYAGGVAMLLALVGGFIALRDRLARVFAIAAVLWLLYAYDLFGAYEVFRLIPGLDMAPMNRSQGLWNFLVACLAAIAVDRLERRAGPRRWLAAAMYTVMALAGLFACLWGADAVLEQHALEESPHHRLFLETVPLHLKLLTALYLLSLGCVLVLLLSHRGRLRAAAGLLLVAGVYLATGDLWHRYNPVCEDRFFFPRTTEIEQLSTHVGHERLAILGEDQIPPSSNLAYGLDIPQNYDGMWVRDYDYLYRDHFGDTNNWRPILEGTKRSLQLFGVQWVLAKWDWNYLDNGLIEFGKAGGQAPLRHEILPGKMLEQTFRARSDGLQQVMFFLSTWPHAQGTQLRFRLQDVESGEMLADYLMKVEDVRSTVYSAKHVVWESDYKLEPYGRPVVFRFPPLTNSDGRTYRAILSSPDATPTNGVYAWSFPLYGYGEGESRYAGRKLAGETYFDFSYDGLEQYQAVATIGDYTLHRFRDALPTFSLVGGAVYADTRQEEIELLRVPTFDPHKVVVLPSSGRPEARGFDPSTRRLLQFPDKDWVYMLAADGRTLVHIDDEVTFLANKFRWNQIEHLPLEAKARFVVHDDRDREGKRKHGLRLVVPPAEQQAPLEIIERTPTRIVMKVARREQAWLVAAQTWYPGWKARLNGEETPVLRANYAFQAVEVPPGAWTLELVYEPASWRWGLWIATLAALLSGLGLGYERWAQQRALRRTA